MHAIWFQHCNGSGGAGVLSAVLLVAVCSNAHACAQHVLQQGIHSLGAIHDVPYDIHICSICAACPCTGLLCPWGACCTMPQCAAAQCAGHATAKLGCTGGGASLRCTGYQKMNLCVILLLRTVLVLAKSAARHMAVKHAQPLLSQPYLAFCSKFYVIRKTFYNSRLFPANGGCLTTTARTQPPRSRGCDRNNHKQHVHCVEGA